MLLNSGSMLNLSADVKAKNNKLETIINWGNNTNETYVGKLASNTYFRKHEGKHPFLQARIDIEPNSNFSLLFIRKHVSFHSDLKRQFAESVFDSVFSKKVTTDIDKLTAG